MNAGNDMFVFGDVQGNPHASGSSNWSDVIEMVLNDAPSPGHGGAWSEEVEGQKIVDGHTPDKDDIDSGGGNSDQGSLGMDHIDKLQW